MRKMTINPASTNYAPNIASCAEIKKSQKEVRQKKKNNNEHVLRLTS